MLRRIDLSAGLQRTAAVALICSAIVAIASSVGARSQTILLGDERTPYDLTTLAPAVFEDPSGELDIDEISRGHDSGTLSSDASSPDRRSVFWFRFSALTPPGISTPWYLAVSNSCLTADLYEPDARGGYDHRSFGWSIPFAKHPYPGGETALLLDRAALTGRPDYLRLSCQKSSIAASIASGFWLSAEWSDYDVPDSSVVLVMLAFVVLGIVFAALTRERIYLLSAGPPLMISMFQTFLGGNLSRSFPSLAMPPYEMTHTVIVVVFFITQWIFMRAFLDMRLQMPALDRILIVALVALLGLTVFPVNSLAFSAGESIFYLIPMAGAAIAWRNGSRQAAFFVVGMAGLIVGFVGLNLSLRVGVSILPLPLLQVVNRWAIPFESLTLFTGIADRFRRTVLESRRALLESDAAKTALVEAQIEHISEIERRNRSFARFVPREFLEQLARTDIADVGLGDSAERDMSILFTDIRGFTTLVETLSPAETFAFLNGYLKRAGPAIRQNAGFIDKYIGDAIMALFPRHPEDAVEAALTLQREVRQFNDVRARRGDLPIAIGIGINFGSLMLGTIGEVERLETTVLADAVNVASRFEGLTKRYGAGIIAGEALVRALPQDHPYHIRPLGVVQLKGFSQTVSAYEIFDGDPSDLLLHKNRTLDDFTLALAAYRQGSFDESRRRFEEIAVAHANDRGAAWLRDRSAILAKSIDLGWDGVDRLESK